MLGSFVSFMHLKFSVSGSHLVLPETYCCTPMPFLCYISSCSPVPDTLFHVCHRAASWVFPHHSPSVFLRQAVSLNLNEVHRAQLVPSKPWATCLYLPRAALQLYARWPVSFSFLSFFFFNGFWESNTDLNCLQSKHSYP